MSGFRKFRSNLHRRRRSIEAVELGYLTGPAAKEGTTEVPHSGSKVLDAEVPASREALEIGPQPIAWLRPKRPETDN